MKVKIKKVGKKRGKQEGRKEKRKQGQKGKGSDFVIFIPSFFHKSRNPQKNN